MSPIPETKALTDAIHTSYRNCFGLRGRALRSRRGKAKRTLVAHELQMKTSLLF